MSPRLPSLTAPELARILERHGFERVRQSGSHLILRHPDGRRVTLPMHRKDLGRGLLSRIIKDAELTDAELT